MRLNNLGKMGWVVGVGIWILAGGMADQGMAEEVLIPNDPGYSWQYNKTNFEKIYAPQAWTKTTGSDQIIVAIVGSRIDVNHPDLKENIYVNRWEIAGDGIDNDSNGYVDDVSGWDFHDNDNNLNTGNEFYIPGSAGDVGTIIGAVGNDGMGTVGVAWKVKLLPIKVGSANNVTYDRMTENLPIARAIRYAADMGAHIINMGWIRLEQDPLITQSIQYAYNKNCVLVTAVNTDVNDPVSNLYIEDDTFPSNLPTVITVGSLDLTSLIILDSPDNVLKALRGAYGSDLVAPVLYNNSQGSHTSGPRIAVAYVSGSVALILSYYRQQGVSLDNNQVKQILRKSATKIGGQTEWDPRKASGLLNVGAALSLPSIPPVAVIQEIRRNGNLLDIYGFCYASQGTTLKEWRLEVKEPGGSSWKRIASGNQEIKPVHPSGTTEMSYHLLGSLDITDFMQGLCVLRLSVEDQRGELGEDADLWIVRDLYSSAVNFRTYRKGEKIEIRGTVAIPDLDHFEFFSQKWNWDYFSSTNRVPLPEDCPFPLSRVGIELGGNKGHEKVFEGPLATIDTSKLETTRYRLTGVAYRKGGGKVSIMSDYSMDIDKFIAGTRINKDGAIYFLVIDPIEMLEGWPLEYGNRFSSTANGVVGEIDKTKAGLEMIVSGGTHFPVTVLGSDGKKLPGWEEQKGKIDSADTFDLKDLDQDGEDEIILNMLYIFEKDGSFYSGWPQEKLNSPLINSPLITPSGVGKGLRTVVFIGSGTGTKVLLVTQRTETINNGSVALDAEGELYSLKGNFLKRYGQIFGEFVRGVDLNSDGIPEICTSSRKLGKPYKIAVYDLDGNLLHGWPITTDYGTPFPSFVDFDKDRRLEIVVPSQNLHIFTKDGMPFSNGLPPSIELRSTVVSGDITGDGKIKLVGLKNTPIRYPDGFYHDVIYAVEVTHTAINSVPIIDKTIKNPLIQSNGGQYLIGPLLEDVDGDGVSDIIVASHEQIEAYKSNGQSIPGFPKLVSAQLTKIAIADVNQDGVSDLVGYAKAPKRTIERPFGRIAPGPFYSFRHIYVWPTKPSSTSHPPPGNQPPVLTQIGDQQVNEGVIFAFGVSGSDANGDDLDLTISSLPIGAQFRVSLDEKGKIEGTLSWQPDFSQAGKYPVTFTLSNGKESVSEAIKISVLNVNRAPVMNPIGVQKIEEKKLLSFTVSASDPDGDGLIYSANGLPTGASLDSQTGLFSWTPTSTQAGVYSVTFRVSDGNLSASQTITPTVVDINQAPQVKYCYLYAGYQLSNKEIYQGQEVSFYGYGVDPDGKVVSYSWRSSLDGELSKQSFFRSSALSVGTHTITFKVQDNDGEWSQEVTHSLIVKVKTGNQAPVVSWMRVMVYNRSKGQQVYGYGLGSDPDGKIVQYSWRSSLDGDLGTRTYFLKPLSKGTHTISLKVQDNDGVWSQEKSQTVTVK